MVVNSIRRILVAVVLALGITGLGAGLASADVLANNTTAGPPTFTPPYVAP